MAYMPWYELDFLKIQVELNQILTAGQIATIVQHYQLPATITHASEVWKYLNMQGKFDKHNVLDFTNFLEILNTDSSNRERLREVIRKLDKYDDDCLHNDIRSNVVSRDDNKISHHALPPAVGIRSDQIGPVNLMGPLVVGSVGVPYYNHKRKEEVPTEDEKECRLCMTNEKYVVMQPCGCVCLCGHCALTYSEKTCIACTKPVSHLQGLRI